MSAHDLRELFRHRVQLELGTDKEPGVTHQVTGRFQAAIPKDYSAYRDLAGYIRGLDKALEFLDECYRQMHEPPPEDKKT